MVESGVAKAYEVRQTSDFLGRYDWDRRLTINTLALNI
jgi:hypothetical protein